MKTLVVHEADLSSENVFCEWIRLMPDVNEVHELSLFYREQEDDRAYLKTQIKKAIKIYNIEKVIMFNYCCFSINEMVDLLQQEFPLVSFEQQSR